MEKRKQQAARMRERRLRRKYQRNIKIAIAISLVLGLAAGFAAGRVTAPRDASPATVPVTAATPSPSDAPEATPAAASEAPEETSPAATEAPNALTLDDADAPQTVSATLLPTAGPSAAPTEAPEEEAEEIVVPFGETQEISVQINGDGSLHREGDAQAAETLDFSVRALRYLTPEYYQENYGSRYSLKGNEAGVEFELLLNDYMGDAEIVPANLLTFTLETADGAEIEGYQLTATEIESSTLSVETNVPTNAYKRFDFDESVGDVAYLVVTASNGGETQRYLFEVGDPLRPTPSPEPTASYSTLQSGSTGSSVMRLQERLIELGYLDDTADGNYGANTEEAVRAAQADFGLEETGVADHDFQVQLYEDE